MPLQRNDLPPDNWPRKYFVGRLLFTLPYWVPRWGGKQIVWWRKVRQDKFLSRYYNGNITARSHPEDVLALFHAGDIQRFGDILFRSDPV